MKSAFNKNTQPAILRVFQSKNQTNAFYNKISHVYDVLSERSEAPMRKAGLELLKTRIGESVLEIGFGTGHCLVALTRAVGPNGRVVGMSKEGGHDPLIGGFEWTHKHFPNCLDCRPIYVREALEMAGFKISKALKKHRWIPVEIILGIKE